MTGAATTNDRAREMARSMATAALELCKTGDADLFSPIRESLREETKPLLLLGGVLFHLSTYLAIAIDNAAGRAYMEPDEMLREVFAAVDAELEH